LKIAEALERLNRLLEELEDLRNPPYNNNELERCANKVDVIVKDTFGKDSDEYKYSHPPRFTSIPMYPTEEEKQKWEQDYHLREINTYKLGIQKILDKHKILTPSKRLLRWIRVTKIGKAVIIAIPTASALLGTNWDVVKENFNRFIGLFS